MLHFPQEIVNIILDEFVNEPPTLLACSVVSSSFKDASQKHLFRKLTLHLGTEYEEANRGRLDILLSNFRLGTYVKSLSLFLHGPEGICVVLKILQHLTRVQSFQLANRSRHRTTWKSLPPLFTNTILEMIRSQTIPTISLGYTDFPLISLRYLPDVKHLSLPSSIPFRNHWDQQEILAMLGTLEKPKSMGYLKSFSVETLDQCKSILEALDHPDSFLSLSHLHNFKSTLFGDAHVDVLHGIFKLAANSLSSISITMHCNQPYSRGLDLKKLSKLKDLNFIILSFGMNKHSGPLLLRTLKSIPSNNRLDRVVIKGHSVLDMKDRDWTQLDELLTSDTTIPSPSSVIIKLYNATDHNVTAWRLPKLVSCGSLVLLDEYLT